MFDTAKQWVAWRTVTKKGVPTKVPVNPHTRGNAMPNNLGTWGTRQQAEAACKAIKGDGIGLMLGPVEGKGVSIGGADLDSCRDPDTGVVLSWAQEIVDRLGSYCEVSPSGTGLKVFFTHTITNAKAAIFKQPGKKHPPGIELYFSKRFFTVTNRVVEDSLLGEAFPLRALSPANLEWLTGVAGPKLTCKAGKLSAATKPLQDGTVKPPRDLPLDEIKSCLALLDLETWCEGRDGWLKVGMALHHQFGGDEEGYDLWTEFSQQSGKFNEEVQRSTWAGFDSNRAGAVTMATLLDATRDGRNATEFDVIPGESERVLNVSKLGTDTSNAHEFAKMYGGELLYIYDGDNPAPHTWDGVSFVPCKKAEDEELAISFAQRAWSAALGKSGDTQKAVARLQQRATQSSMLALAKALPEMKAHESEFNLDPMLLGVANGVVDLRTGQLIEGDRSQRISKRGGTAFDASATCPLWERFLREIIP